MRLHPGRAMKFPNQTGGTIIESSAHPDHVQNVNTKYKVKRLGKAMKLLGQKSRFDVIGTQGATSLVGLQAGSVWSSPFQQSDIEALYNAASQAWNATTLTEIKKLASNPTYSGNRIMLSKVRNEVRLVNQSPNPVEIELYVLISKISESGVADPITDWTSDLNNIRGGNIVTPTMPYVQPNGTIFRRNWRKIKHYKVSMGPGCTHQLNWTFSPNRVMDMDYVKDFATIKGITSKIMIVQRGTVGDDANATSIGSISLSISKLVGSVRQSFETQLLNYWPKTVTQDNNYATGVTSLYQQDENEQVEDVLLPANFA